MVLWDEIFSYDPDASGFLFRKHLTSKESNNKRNNNNKTRNEKAKWNTRNWKYTYTHTHKKDDLSYFSRSDLCLWMHSKGMHSETSAYWMQRPYCVTHQQNKENFEHTHTTHCVHIAGEWTMVYKMKRKKKIFCVDLICYTLPIPVNAIFAGTD